MSHADVSHKKCLESRHDDTSPWHPQCAHNDTWSMGGDRDQNHIEQSYIIVCWVLERFAFSEKNMGHQKQNLTYVTQEFIYLNNEYLN